MKLNNGFVGAIIIFLVAALAVGAFYLKKENPGIGSQMNFFSIFDKKINLDFSKTDSDPLVVAGPKVDTGADLSIKYPQTSVTLKAKATSPDGGPLTYTWFKLSGGIGNIVSPYSDTTVVKGLKRGKYLFRLIATDSNGVKSSDEVVVTMEGGPAQVVAKVTKKVSPKVIETKDLVPDKVPAPNPTQNPIPTPIETPIENPTRDPDITPPDNIIPLSNAGPSQSITLPNSTATLFGNGADPDGSITSYSWTKVSGDGGTITSPSEATTTVTGLNLGSYVFRLTVTDNRGDTASSTVSVTVNSVPTPVNIPPSADAGSDQFIILPDSSATLSGSGSDLDGQIVSYLWLKLEGDGGVITSPSSATTTVTNLLEGSYVFELTVTDNSGDTDSTTVAVNVSVD